ncbi:MAG: hypothetical protein ABIH92_05695 [Nanoarchaeota archaeon]
MARRNSLGRLAALVLGLPFISSGCGDVPRSIGMYTIEEPARRTMRAYMEDTGAMLNKAITHALSIVDDGDQIITRTEAYEAFALIEPYVEKCYEDVLALKPENKGTSIANSSEERTGVQEQPTETQSP